MATQRLFDTVERLRAQRKADEQAYLQDLTGRGRAGYAIGKALGSLFGGSTSDPEMLQAQREDAYAKEYLMTQDPEQRSAMRQGAYALSTDLGQKLDAVDAASAESQIQALKDKLSMEKTKAEIAKLKREAQGTGGKPSKVTAESKGGIEQYKSLIENDPVISKLVDPLTNWKPSWLGGSELSSSELNDLLINRASTIRQNQKGLGYYESLLKATQEYISQAGNTQQPTTPTKTQTQQTDTRTLVDAAQP